LTLEAIRDALTTPLAHGGRVDVVELPGGMGAAPRGGSSRREQALANHLELVEVRGELEDEKASCEALRRRERELLGTLTRAHETQKDLEELIDETVEALATQEQANKACGEECGRLREARRESERRAEELEREAQVRISSTERGIEAERRSHDALEKENAFFLGEVQRLDTEAGRLREEVARGVDRVDVAVETERAAERTVQEKEKECRGREEAMKGRLRAAEEQARHIGVQWAEAESDMVVKETAWHHRIEALHQDVERERAQREALEVASESANAVVLVAKVNHLMEEVASEKAARRERDDQVEALQAQLAACTEQLRRF